MARWLRHELVMSHGEVLPSNEDDPRFRRPVEAPDEEATPEARMSATPGEPGLSKVPMITQPLLRDEDEDKAEDEEEERAE